MTFEDDLVKARDDILGVAFDTRQSNAVPATTDVGYNQAVKINATYLYADMVDSSGLVAISPKETVGKVLRLYLDLSVRIIRNNSGAIRSFDGDRVMAVFVGLDRRVRAVRSAMQIRWTCQNLIQPELDSRFKSIRQAGWNLRPGSGIASGEALIARGGVRRSSNDLVSVGVAPNFAAKLSDKRSWPYHVRVGKATYTALDGGAKYSDGKNMWDGPYTLAMGGKSYSYYRSNYRWSV